MQYTQIAQSAKQLLFDVSSVLGRAASALVQRGIEIRPGLHPSTDGKATIYLPEALRRFMTGEEIDLVRYVVHHEQSHILYTDMSILKTLCREEPINVSEVVTQCLEDIRIEGMAMSKSLGAYNTFKIGRALSLSKWEEAWPNMGQSLNRCLVHLIYGGHVDPELRLAATSQTGLVNDIHCALVDLYPAIDRLQYADNTADLSPMVFEICQRFKDAQATSSNPSADNEQQEDDPEGDQEGGGGEGTGKGGGDVSGESEFPTQTELDLAQEASETQPCDLTPNNGDDPEASGGMAESALDGLDAKGSEEACSLRSESLLGTGRGMSLGSTGQFNPDAANSRRSIDWAKRQIGQFTQVINLLRGDSRSGYSPPMDTGVRIHQPSVPAFIRGFTSSVLRKKIKSPAQGTAVVFVVDDSSSMRGKRAFNTWRAAALLACACDRAKFPLAIIRFANYWSVCKSFSTPLARCRKVFAFGGGGGTDMGPAFAEGVAMLAQRREPRKVMFVLTDGHTEKMVRPVASAQREGIEVIPVMFGDTAVATAAPGGHWYRTGALCISDRNAKNLAPSLVNALTRRL